MGYLKSVEWQLICSAASAVLWTSWTRSAVILAVYISSTYPFPQSPWEEVRREMVEEKGLSGEAADRIGEFVQMSGGQVH